MIEWFSIGDKNYEFFMGKLFFKFIFLVKVR
jgi:hypothetical protein